MRNTIKYNARGIEIQSGKLYRNAINNELVVIRTAHKQYTCETCTANICIGDWYSKPAAKFATNKYCLDCVGVICT